MLMRLRLWGAAAACLFMGLAAYAEPFDDFVAGRAPATSTLGATDTMPVVQGGETRKLFPQIYFMRPDGSNATLPGARTAILPTPTLDNCLVGNGTDWTSASCPGGVGTMLATASNATLPDARTNLGLGTASTPSFAAQFLLATDPAMTAFVPPGFGGPWLANSRFSTTGTTTHAGESRSTLNINRTTSGSGQNGPASSDVTLFLTINKTDWLTSTVDGEINPIYIVSRQGLHGDGGGILADVGKVRGGTAGMVAVEPAVRWLDSSGNDLMNLHTIVGYAPSTGDISNNTAHGFYAGNYGPSVAGAANKVDPYSAFTSTDIDSNVTCPANCSFWQNFLTGTVGLNQPSLTYFQVKAGPTLAGDILQGAGAAEVAGVSTQSSGLRITTKNVGGDWRLYASDGTTVFKQTQQSVLGGGVIDRLNGPTPQSVWRDTGVGLTVGGLHRLIFTDGVGYWQTNTAAGGDFATSVAPYSISTAGVMTINSPSLITPHLGVATTDTIASSGAFRASGSESQQFQFDNAGQEWRLNSQSAAGGGLWYLYDLTNGKFPFTAAANSAVTLNIGPTNATLVGGTLTGLPAPSAASDAVPKSYADSIASGIVTHAAAVAKATGNLTATYNNGTAGVGATLTNSGTLEALVLDGITINNGDRVLIPLQTNTFENGIFTQTTAGTGAIAWVLTRATDFDAAASNEVAAGNAVVILLGSVGVAKTQWLETGQGPFTIGTTPIVFSQIESAASGSVNSGTANQLGYYAGTGNAISGLTSCNNGTIITSAGGVPSCSSTLPNAVQDLVTRLGTVVAGVWSGTAIGVSKGGTAADLSATGGASQVLKQESAGAAVTVGTLSCADLSNDAASCSTDTTDAANISAGLLPLARLPAIPTSNFSTTATNDNAAAGKLGEYVTGLATAVALTSTTQVNITSISLTAGDWDVTASVKLNPAATTTSTVRAAGVTTTSATMPTALNDNTALARFTGAITAGQGSHVLNTDAARQSLAGTTTVYCVAQATFATSTMTADCRLRARRVR